jgi:hypothetical protein
MGLAELCRRDLVVYPANDNLDTFLRTKVCVRPGGFLHSGGGYLTLTICITG